MTPDPVAGTDCEHHDKLIPSLYGIKNQNTMTIMDDSHHHNVHRSEWSNLHRAKRINHLPIDKRVLEYQVSYLSCLKRRPSDTTTILDSVQFLDSY